MQIFNVNNLRNKQRFPIAVLAGVMAMIGCSFIYALIYRFIGIRFSLLYVAMAFGIGYAIKYFGRGVDSKFCILAIMLFFISIYLADIFSFWMGTGAMNGELMLYCLKTTTASFMHFSVSSLRKILFAGFGFYVAYYEARVL